MKPIIKLSKFQNQGLPFKVQTLQESAVELDDIDEVPHSHDFYEITLITKGAGILHADLNEYALNENVLSFVGPGQVHQLSLSDDAQGFIISFKDSFADLGEYELDLKYEGGLFQLFSHIQVLSVQRKMISDIIEIIVKMVKEYQSEYSFKAQILRRYLKVFLIYVSRQFEWAQQNIDQTRETQLTKRFMELLEKNFKEKKMVSDYAAQLFITPNYLNGIIKKNTGFSAGHHIRQRVVLEAKRLGHYSDVGMKEIAYNLGFDDSSHFSKFFKAVSGMNFTDFKKGGQVISLFPQQGHAA